MVDIENKVYTRLKTALSGLAKTSSTYARNPSSFPFVSIEMASNTMAHLDNADTEKFSICMFEINVYANDKTAKTTAKDLLQIVDTEMYKMNMERISYSPVPNLEDATIYRLAARYECVTDGNYTYRR